VYACSGMNVKLNMLGVFETISCSDEHLTEDGRMSRP
jgi:hypothetical protein